jgi:hypothetical protein
MRNGLLSGMMDGTPLVHPSLWIIGNTTSVMIAAVLAIVTIRIAEWKYNRESNANDILVGLLFLVAAFMAKCQYLPPPP